MIVHMKQENTYSTKYIGVLDGIRAISIIIVLIFHFWQQTWIFPRVSIPFPVSSGAVSIDFTPFAKVGYLFVDMMILISGFLLFLPVARNVFCGEPLRKWGAYFRSRAIRILPSYLLCVIVLFLYSLITGAYGDPVDKGFAVKDLLLHLTFMQTWTIKTYLATNLNVVLWTLAVEVWFYILFPLFALFIRRRKNENSAAGPLIRTVFTAAVLLLLSFAYIYGYVLNSGSAFANAADNILSKLGSGITSKYPAMTINQLPAFFEVYAVGMCGAMLYVYAANKLKKKNWIVGILGTMISVGAIILIVLMVKDCAKLSLADAQTWQVKKRLLLALVFMLFILSTAFSLGFWRFVFSNKFMAILSAISYNLYIWHQWLCVKIKSEWRIPFWEGDTPPNQWGTPEGSAWAAKYAIIITVAAFAVAALVTYLYEKPVTKALSGKKNGK